MLSDELTECVRYVGGQIIGKPTLALAEDAKTLTQPLAHKSETQHARTLNQRVRECATAGGSSPPIRLPFGDRAKEKKSGHFHRVLALGALLTFATALPYILPAHARQSRE